MVSVRKIIKIERKNWFPIAVASVTMIILGTLVYHNTGHGETFMEKDSVQSEPASGSKRYGTISSYKKEIEIMKGIGIENPEEHVPFLVPKPGSTFDSFLRDLKTGLDARMREKQRPIEWITGPVEHKFEIQHPSCYGLWLEFGVFTGGTLNATADLRRRLCGESSDYVYGFDTFTGLPEDWNARYAKGAFKLSSLPPVLRNAKLVPGLFNESLPPFLETIRKRNKMVIPPVTYLHIDCDLYAGAHDVLTILQDYIAPGCVVIFDELVNYEDYRKHEVKAFWEYLEKSSRKAVILSMRGPLPGLTEAVELNPVGDGRGGGFYQSAAFLFL